MTSTYLPVKDTGPEQISRIWVATLVALLASLVTCTAGARPPATERPDRDMERTDMGWMQQLREMASHGIYMVERASDDSRNRLSKRAGSSKPQQIAAYSGYANDSHVWVHGRVLASRPIATATGAETWWQNLHATFQRWESDEVAAAEVKLRYGDKVFPVVTDDEGYYAVRLDRNPAVPASEDVTATYADGEVLLIATHRVFSPHRDAQYLIVSDMDDTVLHTGITDLLTAARLTFLGNAKSRKPLPGVAGLYRALMAGGEGTATNPIFYVSNSGWNLYDLLDHFIEINDLPGGPLLLRDLGFNDRHASSREHKAETVRHLLERFTSLPVVLIGDSGQHDAEIYADIATSFPGRVLAIYVRDIDPRIDSPYDLDVDSVFDEFSGTQVPMVRGEDSRAFAEHMQTLGILPLESSERVAGSAIRDDQRGRVGR